ncbi:hypothetical protein [Pedobacter frigoris]|uniref:Uncharacterized protein n=1 Tax=Pedobacter frigoris TaxID=2571272 RepID=A0A4U1CLN0_9SPHI|nr:hypothetical protein [Pedobacter frigoris]TKC07456.1 hypothetical protein FA047_09425 [Pedobacter frigoris]
MNNHKRISALIFLSVAIIFGCKDNDKGTPKDEECGYTITITEAGNAFASYTNNCTNAIIGQSNNELSMVLNSPDTKYSLTINIKGAIQGDYVVKNEPPYGSGTATLFLTSDQSKIPGALSFFQGKFIITKFKDQTADGTMNATVTSTVNKKTYTLTGEFKNMPVKKILM